MTNQGINREKINNESGGAETAVTTGRINRIMGRAEDCLLYTYPETTRRTTI